MRIKSSYTLGIELGVAYLVHQTVKLANDYAVYSLYRRGVPIEISADIATKTERNTYRGAHRKR